MLRDVPHSGLNYMFYTSMKDLASYVKYGNYDEKNLNKIEQESLGVIMLCGGLSSCLATVVVQPFDAIRVNMQVNDQNLKILDAYQKIVNKKGWNGLFVGSIPRICRKGVQGVLTWTLYEKMLNTTNESGL